MVPAQALCVNSEAGAGTAGRGGDRYPATAVEGRQPECLRSAIFAVEGRGREVELPGPCGVQKTMNEPQILNSYLFLLVIVPWFLPLGIRILSADLCKRQRFLNWKVCGPQNEADKSWFLDFP